MAASLVSFSPSSLTVLRLPTSRRPGNFPNKLGNRSCNDPKLSHRIQPLTTARRSAYQLQFHAPLYVLDLLHFTVKISLQSVRRIIAKQLSVEETTVTPQSKFPDLGAGSGDTVELITPLEEELEVSIGEGSAENLSTVQDETLGRSYHQDFYPVLKKFIVFFFKFIFD